MQGLKNVQKQYKAVVARKFLHAFQVEGYEKERHYIGFKEFIRGLYGEASEFETLDQHISNDEEYIIVPRRNLNGLPKSSTITIHKSIRSATAAKITVEIPARTSITSLEPKPSLSRDLSTISEEDDHIQYLVDSQLAEIGTEFGVTTKPSSLSSMLLDKRSKAQDHNAAT